MWKYKCIFCKKDISMEVEFGGAYHAVDGEFACNKDHYDKWVQRMMNIIEHDDWIDNIHW